MKKTYFPILIVAISILMPLSAFGVGFGLYKPETDYGLIDGFKWNFFNREDNAPLVQIKSETKEEQQRIEQEKLRPQPKQDEVQLYRFMLDNTVAF